MIKDKLKRFKRILGYLPGYPRLLWAKRFGSMKDVADAKYRMTFGRRINWENPEDLNQWINWLQFNTDTSSWEILADKYRMREYVKEKGFGDNLVPLLKVWNSPDEIDFGQLPDQFVLKTNNGSGDVKIIRDKSKADESKIKDYFRDLVSRPFGKATVEPHYMRIPSRIVAEQYLNPNLQTVSYLKNGGVNR